MNLKDVYNTSNNFCNFCNKDKNNCIKISEYNYTSWAVLLNCVSCFHNMEHICIDCLEQSLLNLRKSCKL